MIIASLARLNEQVSLSSLEKQKGEKNKTLDKKGVRGALRDAPAAPEQGRLLQQRRRRVAVPELIGISGRSVSQNHL